MIGMALLASPPPPKQYDLSFSDCYIMYVNAYADRLTIYLLAIIPKLMICMNYVVCVLCV